MVKVTTFDDFAPNYRELVEGSLGVPGQGLEFFVRAKIYHLRQLARKMTRPLSDCSVLDVGCGTGLTDQLLLPYVKALAGVDVSGEMVQEARKRNPTGCYQAYYGASLPFEDGTFDMAFAICVAHHVDPDHWDNFFSELWRVTAVGGLSVVIEHNPLNPLTRRSVDRCAFDDDAVLLGPRRVAEGLRRAGASDVGHRYILFAPFGGDRTRTLELSLSRLPIGAQYAVWSRRRATTGEKSAVAGIAGTRRRPVRDAPVNS